MTNRIFAIATVLVLAGATASYAQSGSAGTPSASGSMGGAGQMTSPGSPGTSGSMSGSDRMSTPNATGMSGTMSGSGSVNNKNDSCPPQTPGVATPDQSSSGCGSTAPKSLIPGGSNSRD
jgi:hypothetical protein